MRYLVTGGAGFIGSHLCEALALCGHEVTTLDDLSTGSRVNLDHLSGEAQRLVEGSVLDEGLVDRLVAENEVVVHLAAAVGVKLIMERPLDAFITNVRGSENVLKAAQTQGRKILVASTSEIYGKSADAPYKEDGDRLLGNLKSLRWAYSTSKAVDEFLALAYHRERGLPAIVVRLFNTVGPRQSPAYGMVLPRLVKQALEGSPLTVYGDGLQTRTFCHVGDVVDAVLLLLESPQAIGDVFNIGSTEEISILELARRVIGITRSNSPIRFVPYEKAYGEDFEDMRRRVPDISRIHGLVGWYPRRSLDDVIDDIVQTSSYGASSR